MDAKTTFKFTIGDRVYHRLYDTVVIDQKRVSYGRPYYRLDNGAIVHEDTLTGN